MSYYDYTPTGEWSDDLLQPFRMQTDPLAEDFIQRVIEYYGYEDAQKLFDVLIHNVDIELPDPPQFVQDYLAESAALPDWADPEKLRAGQEFFADYGPTMLQLLFVKSLPSTYLCWRGAEALAMTGRLEGGDTNPARYGWRIAETAQFLLDVMAPGGLEPGGRGIGTAQRIRLIHASVRTFIPKDRWKEEVWQQPINQEDMAMTIGAFSVCLVQGLQQYGQEIPAGRADAYIHCWQVVGHLLGLDPRLRVETYAEALDQFESILQRQQGASESNALLTKALVDFGEYMMPGKLFDKTIQIFIRFCLGDERTRMLGIEVNPGCFGIMLPGFVARSLGLVEKLEEKSKPLGVLAQELNELVMKGLVKYVRNAKGAPLEIHADLRAKWNIA